VKTHPTVRKKSRTHNWPPQRGRADARGWVSTKWTAAERAKRWENWIEVQFWFNSQDVRRGWLTVADFQSISVSILVHFYRHLNTFCGRIGRELNSKLTQNWLLWVTLLTHRIWPDLIPSDDLEGPSVIFSLLRTTTQRGLYRVLIHKPVYWYFLSNLG